MPPEAAVIGIPGRTAHDLLRDWRDAERRHGAASDAHEQRVAALVVAATWATYQERVAPHGPEVILVADDDRTIVAAAGLVADLLGYEPAELVGRMVDDLAAPDLVETTSALWEQFQRVRREDSVFAMRHKDGTTVRMAYHAEANVPIPGFHVSRLRVLL